MPYDLGKITALEAHHQIVDHISRQLAACSAFNNNSISYFGIEIKYKIELTLHSRGKTQESLQAGRTLGEMPNDPVIVTALAGEGVEAQADHVTITDEQVAGSAARKVGRVENRVAGGEAGKEGGEVSPAGGDSPRPDVGQHKPSDRDEKAQRPHGGPPKRGR